jgi:hypothetical protein
MATPSKPAAGAAQEAPTKIKWDDSNMKST